MFFIAMSTFFCFFSYGIVSVIHAGGVGDFLTEKTILSVDQGRTIHFLPKDTMLYSDAHILLTPYEALNEKGRKTLSDLGVRAQLETYKKNALRYEAIAVFATIEQDMRLIGLIELLGSDDGNKSPFLSEDNRTDKDYHVLMHLGAPYREQTLGTKAGFALLRTLFLQSPDVYKVAPTPEDNLKTKPLYWKQRVEAIWFWLLEEPCSMRSTPFAVDGKKTVTYQGLEMQMHKASLGQRLYVTRAAYLTYLNKASASKAS